MRLVMFLAKMAGAWLVLLVVAWAAEAPRFWSWGAALLVALVVQAAARVAVWLVDSVRCAGVTTAVRGLAWVAVRCGVPAFGLAAAADLVSGAAVPARWPGLSAVWPLFLLAGAFSTRPRRGAACAIEVVARR
ncbi:hypothetical protein [Dactylosporangium sp. NPDC000521]|uniref:hypothetical protein n=1 Tax=Dactylosporangium sp. NPDC000521 TaxID=3363975 RepID=UPI0036C28D47